MVAVKSPILVKQVVFCYQSAVDVAISEVDGRLSLVLNVRDFFPARFPERAVEDQQLTMAEDDAAALEGGMEFGLAIQGS